MQVPKSRFRRKHHKFQQASAIPAKQRTNATTVMTIFLGVFGLLVTYFAGGTGIALAIGTIVGGAAGYYIGYRMRKSASKK